MTRARALLALAVATLTLAGCGEGSDPGTGSGELRWEEAPTVYAPETLPRDKIATGMVRNDSLREISLTARDLRLLDGGGEEVQSSAVFLEGFGKTYYDISREELPEAERLRIGLDARLRPGETAPLTVSWRQAGGVGPPEVVDYGDGTLPLP